MRHHLATKCVWRINIISNIALSRFGLLVFACLDNAATSGLTTQMVVEMIMMMPEMMMSIMMIMLIH